MCERYTICCTTCCEQLTVIYGYTMALGPVREWGERDPLKKNTPQISTWQGFQKTSNWRESTEKTM